ncbi:MAG: UbiA family prenyltransferase [Candidatus Anstonellales archaeon]
MHRISGIFETVVEYFKLTRFDHALMLAFAVFIGESIVLGSPPPLTGPILLSLFVPLFAEMGAFSLNDYFDIATDRANKRLDRPLVRGTINENSVVVFAFLTFAISLILSSSINENAFSIVLIFVVLSILYNIWLKDVAILGNAAVAASMGIPFIFASYVVSTEIKAIAYVLFLIAFIIGMAREIIKDIEDVEGDKTIRKSKTLPIIIGKKYAAMAASVLLLLFIPASAYPFISYFALSSLSLVTLLASYASILYFAVTFYKNPTREYARFTRTVLLYTMFIGLFALFFAALRI